MTEQLTQDSSGAEVQARPAPVRVAWAPVPRVNLLPMEIIEVRRFRRTQVLLGATVMVMVVFAGAGTYLAQRSVDEANDELSTAQSRVSALEAQKTRYASVPAVIAEVDAAKTARALAMGTDVLWYRYLSELDGARPSGVEFTNLSVTMNISTTEAAARDPLSPAGVGLVTIEGTARRYDQVSRWLEALDKITGIDSAALSNATKDEEIVSYQSNATVNSDAISGRYTKKAG
jgi:Tfp pilus assembly protein PilN